MLRTEQEDDRRPNRDDEQPEPIARDQPKARPESLGDRHDVESRACVGWLPERASSNRGDVVSLLPARQREHDLGWTVISPVSRVSGFSYRYSVNAGEANETIHPEFGMRYQPISGPTSPTSRWSGSRPREAHVRCHHPVGPAQRRVRRAATRRHPLVAPFRRSCGGRGAWRRRRRRRGCRRTRRGRSRCRCRPAAG